MYLCICVSGLLEKILIVTGCTPFADHPSPIFVQALNWNLRMLLHDLQMRQGGAFNVNEQLQLNILHHWYFI